MLRSTDIIRKGVHRVAPALNTILARTATNRFYYSCHEREHVGIETLHVRLSACAEALELCLYPSDDCDRCNPAYQQALYQITTKGINIFNRSSLEGRR